MFERYTEPARRTIFFARYEASMFGSPQIETEHLLLGVLRQDKALANRLVPTYARVEGIRNAITRRGGTGVIIATSVDLPLSYESKRALAFGAEESERLNQTRIGTEHLLLGLLREKECFAAQLLRAEGVTLELVREQMGQSGQSPAPDGINRWVAAREAEGRWTIERRGGGNRTTHFALYAADAPSEELEQAQKRIDFIMTRTDDAIANHEFEKARFYSDKEQQERENLRRLSEQFGVRVPVVCVAVSVWDVFPELRQRCEAYLNEGVAEVWLLDVALKRAYIVTKAEGLREFKEEMLRIANPPLEMDLREVFG